MKGVLEGLGEELRDGWLRWRHRRDRMSLVAIALQRGAVRALDTREAWRLLARELEVGLAPSTPRGCRLLGTMALFIGGNELRLPELTTAALRRAVTSDARHEALRAAFAAVSEGRVPQGGEALRTYLHAVAEVFGDD